MAAHTRSYSRRSIENESEPDRLSELPDELLVRILSLLRMKDAFKTAILSKRWENLWTRVDNIVYICTDETYPDYLEFLSDEEAADYREIASQNCISFIDNTLRQCTGKIIKFFYYNECYFMPASEHIDAWVEYVLERKVEHFRLEFERGEINYTFPDCLYEVSSLTKLELKAVKLNVKSQVNWTFLKDLFLHYTTVDDESMDNILMGCPVLETMHLENVETVYHINIMSPSMKTLKLLGLNDAIDHVLEIRAPWLRELVISIDHLVTKLILVDVSSLVKATVNFYRMIDLPQNLEIDVVTEILKSFSHVDELIIESESIQALYRFDQPSTLFSNGGPHTCMPNGNFPHLKTVTIDIHQTGNRECFDSNGRGGDGECFDFEVVAYVLRSAVVLKKLVLCASSKRGYYYSSECPKYLSDFWVCSTLGARPLVLLSPDCNTWKTLISRKNDDDNNKKSRK